MFALVTRLNVTTMNSVLLMALILTGCLVGGIVMGLLIEWCGWWLFTLLVVLIPFVVKGDKS